LSQKLIVDPTKLVEDLRITEDKKKRRSIDLWFVKKSVVCLYGNVNRVPTVDTSFDGVEAF
jgi:hypothetical protein